MAIALTPEQQGSLNEITEIQGPAEFQALYTEAEPEMDRIVLEIMEANQAIEVTLLECSDLYLLVKQHTSQLDGVKYGQARRAFFRDGIRLAKTADAWFSEGKRTGAFRTRTVEEVVKASRPWRERLKAYGEQAFVFQPEIASQFGDVNSTGTIDEERSDLLSQTKLVTQHQTRLAEVGMKPDFVAQGKALLDEANGHGILGILGIRSQQEAIALRNRLLTYVTLLGREARAAGINGCFDDAAARARFEAASFRNALRRVQRKRRGGGGGEEEAAAEGVAAPGEPAKPEGGGAGG